MTMLKIKKEKLRLFKYDLQGLILFIVHNRGKNGWEFVKNQCC